MDWIVLSYSLSSKSGSGLRVAVWRRLRRQGAVSPAGGAHILPAHDECVEAFQWLAKEIRQAGGEALVMRVSEFEGLTDPQLVEFFRQASRQEYASLEADTAALEKAVRTKTKSTDRPRILNEMSRLRRRHADIARVDYFDCPEGRQLAARLSHIEQTLAPAATASITPVIAAEYRNKRWVTRPRPHVDRLACVWLIHRFIDPKAPVRYAAHAKPGEIAFDMDEGQFGHQGNRCTFETMLQAFGLDQPALQAIAEIVHTIDLRDDRYTRLETDGIDAILKGWLLAGLPDAELEAHGVALFEGIYAALTDQLPAETKKKRR